MVPNNNRVDKRFPTSSYRRTKSTSRVDTLSSVSVARHMRHISDTRRLGYTWYPEFSGKVSSTTGFGNVWHHFTNFPNRQTPILAHERFRRSRRKWTDAHCLWLRIADVFVRPDEDYPQHFLTFLMSITFGPCAEASRRWISTGDVPLKCKTRITERNWPGRRSSPLPRTAAVPRLNVVARSAGWGVVGQGTRQIKKESVSFLIFFMSKRTRFADSFRFSKTDSLFSSFLQKGMRPFSFEIVFGFVNV